MTMITAGRLVQVARTAYGLLLLGVPERSPELAGQDAPDPVVTGVVRILGARHLAQAAMTGTRPSTMALRVGAAVDGLHAASMVLLARVSPEDRRPALVSAISATGFSLAAVLASGGGARRESRSDISG